MAVSLGGTGQYLRRTASLPAASAWTLAGWFRVRSVRASQYQYFMDLDDGTNYAVVGYQAAGGWDFGTSAGAGSMAGPTTNVWTFIACTLAGSGAGNFKVYHAAAGASFTVGSSAGASFTPTGMYIGNDFADEWCNVDIAHVRVWDAVLTQAELEQEMYTARPARFANLHLWSPLWSPSDVVDYSGNGRNWTVGGTLATVDGPPVAWGGRNWVVPFAVAAAGTDALTATGITTGAPTVGTPTIAQVHVLSAAAIATAAPTLGAPSMSNTHVLAATGVTTGAPTLATPAIGQVHILAAAGIATALPTLSTPKLLPHTGATVGGVVAASGRYFHTTGAGALVLAGFHTWADISDTASTYPPSAFDWTAYLDALVAKGANYTKLWMMESARDWGDASPMYFAPLPWARTGPGNAADGRLKFDLAQYDTTWFERLRGRAIEAGNRGVYVCVQLFQGWHIEPKGLAYNPWTYHPFNSANNINGINGDANADSKGLETRLTTSTAIYNLQKAYVDAVIAAVGDLDNVIYEISNEDHNDSWDWQVALMGYIRTVEAGRPKQHLVGLTVLWPTSNNSQLAASAADWVSYADTDTTPDANTAGPLSAYDTDHNPNLFTTGRGWIWKALTRGHAGLWLMDEWAGETYGHDTRADATWNVQRANLGYARTYAARLALANATAQGSLSSTGYCLAVTTGRYQLLAYQDGSGAFTVNLSSLSGTFALEWLRPSTGATQAGSGVTGGAVRTLTPPWSGEDAVALLELASHDLTANGITAGAPTVGVPTVGQVHVLGAASVVAGAPVLGATAIGQIHVLTAAAIAAGAPALGASTIGQAHALIAQGIVGGAPAVESPSVGQVHVLAANSLAAGAPDVGAPSMGGEIALFAIGITTGVPTVGVPNVGQVHVLAAVGVTTAAPAVGTPSMGGETALSAQSITSGAPSLGVPVIGQAHILATGDIVAAQPTLAAPTIGQVHTLVAAHLTAGAPVVGAPGMTGEAALNALGVTAGAPVLDAAALGQVHTLGAMAVLAGAPIADAPAISQVHVLVALAIAAGAAALGSPALNYSEVPTPAGRTLTVGYEDRVLVVSFESRIFTVDGG